MKSGACYLGGKCAKTLPFYSPLWRVIFHSLFSFKVSIVAPPPFTGSTVPAALNMSVTPVLTADNELSGRLIVSKSALAAQLESASVTASLLSSPSHPPPPSYRESRCRRRQESKKSRATDAVYHFMHVSGTACQLPFECIRRGSVSVNGLTLRSRGYRV